MRKLLLEKFLEENSFGLAVVMASRGMRGDVEENRLLTQARAMVIRQYLVERFRLDDTRLKTKGLGEDRPNAVQTGDKIEIVVYPAG